MSDKDTIHYFDNDTKLTIKIQSNKIVIIRDNQEFNHAITYELNKTTKSEYYIKELGASIFLDIFTTSLEINKDYLKISYQIKDNNNEFIYLLERVSDE